MLKGRGQVHEDAYYVGILEAGKEVIKRREKERGVGDLDKDSVFMEFTVSDLC